MYRCAARPCASGPALPPWTWHARGVNLRSEDGARVALRPTDYQFGHGSAPPDDWDANWVLVRGEVRTAAGESWSFHDPCLTTWACVELLRWLSAASRGDVAPTGAADEWWADIAPYPKR